MTDDEKVCTVPGCGRKPLARGLCSAHYQRYRLRRSIKSDLFGTVHRDDVEPTYKVWHAKLRDLLGKASAHACADCARPAQHWSYAHDCSDEQSSEFGSYCLHTEHYVPRCVACHSRHDRRHMSDQNGEKNVAAKLTDDDVREIRRLCAEGVWQRIVAERYKISQSNVSMIVNRKTWTHVT